MVYRLCWSVSVVWSIYSKGHDWTCVINQDLPRTFPGHPALGEDGLNALRRMLTAYARHNPAVGYCQVLWCLFFLGMTCDEALELLHTIEGALCWQKLFFLFKVYFPTYVILTLVKTSWILVETTFGTSKDEIERPLHYYQMYDPRACLASLGSTNLSGLQICGWCRQWTFLPLFFYYLCPRRMLSGVCASL